MNDGKVSRRVKRRHGVPPSAEFSRIKHLPRRKWDESGDLDQLIELLTDHLRVPGSGKPPKGLPEVLRPVQAVAIREAHDVQGLLAAIGVGRGKTLISLLIPTVLEAKRPLLIVPPRRRKPTRDMIEVLRRYWKIHPNINILGYSELSQTKNTEIIHSYMPDVIILDEVHSLKARNSARTRRFSRFMKEHEECIVIGMSGTLTKRSLKDFAHISEWCLGDMSPVPRNFNVLGDWANAIDSKIKDSQRLEPGVLWDFCAPGENVRQGYNRRLIETPGVIHSPGASGVDCTLTIRRWKHKFGPEIHDALEKLEGDWETPDGDYITEATQLWRHARTLAQGYWLYWDPKAPPEWLGPRKVWKKHVRETLSRNRRGLDTELQVWNEVSSEHDHRAISEHHCEWCAWKLIKDTFKPNPVPGWYTQEVAEAAVRWLNEHNGIVWVDSPHIGREVARKSGARYFGAGEDGIEEHKGKIVASIPAHGVGANLQFHHNHALVLAPPTAGDVWEQLLGRMHRQGQEADNVIYEVNLGSDALMSAFIQSQADAVYLQHTQGTEQKLNIADIEV